jgi:DNA adenine methylase
MTGPIPYIGGKHRVAQKIIDIFPADHKTYIEPFAGGAQLLFHKKPSPVEILNDLDGEIVNFFRVCQSHHEELLRTLRFTVASRQLFSMYQAQNPATLTDVQRAARLFYLQKNAFGGLVVKQNYHYCVAQPANLNPEAIPQLIENVHKRLARVQIECLPYEQILKRYDRPATLFYLDPPYWDRKLYRFNFTTADFTRLEERLRNLRGKFVLSLNDVPEVRELFKRYVVQGIEFAYSSQRTAGKKYRELLIANFPFKLKPPQELPSEPNGPTRKVNS